MSCLEEAYGTTAVLGATPAHNIHAVSANASTPLGPYLASLSGKSVTLAPVYRLYHDEYQAFMNGILPNGSDGAFRYVPGNTVSDATVGVPVPSRLYSRGVSSKSKPLKGFRVTVKDIIDIKGIKTSQGNRAWFKLYDAVNATSPGLQKLLNLGADIVGKTKTAQFANADRPTADWVDYQ